MGEEAKRWLRQAEADLKAAKHSIEAKDFEWSCFQSQQSGEKVVKSYLYDKGYISVITHSLKELCLECIKIESNFSQIMSEVKMLDIVYISTRYPNSLAGNLAPVDFYEEEDAKRCLNCAELILNIVKRYIEK